MPTGLERVSAGMYADNLIAEGTHQDDGEGNAVRRLSYPRKRLVESKSGVREKKRKRRRAVGTE